MLTSSLGLLAYFLLPNDVVWGLMSPAERDLIRKANQLHNTSRADYADPARYGGGRGFDSPRDAVPSYQERALATLLERSPPASVLEVGPGSGYLTRTMVEQPALRRYVAVDINPAFLDFLRPKVEAVGAGRGLEAEWLISADVPALERPVEAIMLFSAVHHIPDREDLFRRLTANLVPGGRILATDPTHYWPRLRGLVDSIRRHGYLTQAYRDNIANLSTHHFCSLREYRRICRRIPGLAVEDARFFHPPKRVQQVFGALRRLAGVDGPDLRERSLLARWASSEMAITLKWQ